MHAVPTLSKVHHTDMNGAIITNGCDVIIRLKSSSYMARI